jgi:catechol 2,3-dioxygenase-like lactoylglutathione lyase family enzyme
MFDHVGVAVSDLAASESFYRTVLHALGREVSYAGCSNDGAPGHRPLWGPKDDGCALLDPDGNRVEAIHGERGHPAPDGCIDHLWLRVHDPRRSWRFYETIASHAGLSLAHDERDHVCFAGWDFSLSLLRGGHPRSEQVHHAFPADTDAVVRAFHAAALAAGYEDHGAPGERSVYHPGYYGALVLDPDGLNVEVVNHNR